MANITIVGSGNSGCAHACLLTKLGHDVTLLKTSNSLHNENFDFIKENGGMFCKYFDKPDETFIKFHQVTRDVKDAFSSAEYVFILTQSLQHEKISEMICPYIQDVLGIIIVPGNLGSQYFRPKLSDNVWVAEGESTVVDARLESPGHLHILFANVRNALSFNPSKNAVSHLAEISSILPNYTHLRTNVIETALHNPNLIVHTIGTIMSAARIEKSGGEFWLYKEGFTPSIWNIINALDNEKNDVIAAYGGQPMPYVECCKFRNEESETIDAMEAFTNYAYYGSPKGPGNINNRYLTEDIPNGLCLLSSLGEKAGIPTPVCDSLITIGSCLLNTDFRTIGRTVERLGWKNMEVKEIIEKI